MALVVKNPPASAGNARDPGSISGLGKSPGGRNGNPLQYFCLENPMDREAWRATSMESQRVGHNCANESEGKRGIKCELKSRSQSVLNRRQLFQLPSWPQRTSWLRLIKFRTDERVESNSLN